MVQKVLPSVVQMTTGRDLGSGIVFHAQGDVVTNAHVVAQATGGELVIRDDWRVAAVVALALVGTWV